MKAKLIVKVIGIGLVGMLAGCTSLNAAFDCPMKPGVLCKSVSDVNTLIEQGQLGGLPATTLPASKLKTTPFVMTANAKEFAEPTRIPEQIARIWIAPYEDSEGDYYSATMVYHIVKPSGWIGKPVSMTEAKGEAR